jgi:hypothetical protein
VAVACRSSDLLVCCSVWYFFFDDVIDVGYTEICMDRLVVYIPGE